MRVRIPPSPFGDNTKAAEEILVRYGEIFLKSEFVRKIYEKKLVENIKCALKRSKIYFKVRQERGRIFVDAKQTSQACEALKKVFGIVSISPSYRLRTVKMKDIKNFCRKNYEKWIRANQSFAIDARRAGTQSYTSKDLEKELGSVIDRKVNLEYPDVTIGVEVRERDTYIYTQTIECLGGMPVSTSGKVIALLSGGIDSPVAAFLAMKRGCSAVFAHFHSFPLVSKKSIDKVKILAKILSEYQRRSILYLVPFHEIQSKIKSAIHAKYRIIIYRRMMLRIAEELAKKEGAKALVTGESLAQVSSQTLDNMTTIEAVTSMPVLRPLVGMDKNEIVNMARNIGTYEVSIRPQEDCCTLFVPKHTATKSTPSIAEKLEKGLKVGQMVLNAVKDTEKVVF